jgi:site-specific recombinase XerD
MTVTALHQKLPGFIRYLIESEYAENSRRGYEKDLHALFSFLVESANPAKIADKEALLAYKEALTARLAPATVNRHIAAINLFLKWAGLEKLCLKALKVQERTTATRNLTICEFELLIDTAMRTKKEKVALIMLTLASTGIRIGEMRYITAEAVECGAAIIHSKGRIRTVILPTQLKQSLEVYIKKRGIKSGPVFLGPIEIPISRSYVAWAMKDIAKKCGIDPTKIFPHNLRHYFARRFLEAGNLLSDLADTLGHKSIDTTRRYLHSTEAEKREQIGKVRVLSRPQDAWDFWMERAWRF